MRILVTGSAGHLGEALMRTLRARGESARGIDIVRSEFTDIVGSIVNRQVVTRAMTDVDAVIHAATLHKPHVATHARQAFIDTNLTGTLNLLEVAATVGVRAFVFTSTTSVFGDALMPPPGAPAAWIDEDVTPVAKNIYGATKAAAEDLCRVIWRKHALPCVILRTSLFFLEPDDDAARRAAFDDDNLKVNELLYRRVDIDDVVEAHVLALARAPALGFARYVISATTPFKRADLPDLRERLPEVVARRVPEMGETYARRGWRLPAGIDRVYVNARAREELGWRPRYDFANAIASLRDDRDYLSPLARTIGIKGYHQGEHADGLYPVDM
jgi:nucleoside-diphosphate-sugar epimerase